MDWLNIIETILIILAGGIIFYVKNYSKIPEKALEAFNAAEKAYETWTESCGTQKMDYAVNYIFDLIPKALQKIITKDIIRTILQSLYDETKLLIKKKAEIASNAIEDKIEEVTEEIKNKDNEIK
jgi:sugar-specific transcriptional regulator TrmB